MQPLKKRSGFVITVYAIFILGSHVHAFTQTHQIRVRNGKLGVSSYIHNAQKRLLSNQDSYKRLVAFSSSSDSNDLFESPSIKRMQDTIMNDTSKSTSFSLLMALCGAMLGPFLDSYHSLFGVLKYNHPLSLQLWSSSSEYPALVTTVWVPILFGLAGFIIGWLTILLDSALLIEDNQKVALNPSVSKILVTISFFTLQYYLSGVLFYQDVSRSDIFVFMSILALGGFQAFDQTKSGLITSFATALGGPMIEVGLISFFQWTSISSLSDWGYHYMDSGELGFFPLWIIPVYFLGGPAVGNLARGIWNQLGTGKII